MSKSICWLCQKTKKLCSSHVIPKFVFRWLIKSGGTPYLRKGDSPNVRRQDGDKHFLYCRECEVTLSKWEDLARNKVFEPATRREDISGPYGPWLSRFACSLALRTIQSQKFRKLMIKYDDKEIHAIESAENLWRQFLLGEIGNPGKFKLYMIYIGHFDHFDAENLPKNWNTWVHRSVERDTLYTENGNFLCTYTKLGPLIFLGKISDGSGILGEYFLRCNDGLLPKSSLQVSGNLWRLFLDRARNSEVVFSQISDKQKEKSKASVEKHAKRFAKSDLLGSLVDDFRQFGPKD